MLMLFRIFSAVVPIGHLYILTIYLLLQSNNYSIVYALFFILLTEFIMEISSGKSDYFCSDMSYPKIYMWDGYLTPLYLCFFSQLTFVIFFGYEYIQLEGEAVKQFVLIALVGLTNGTIGFNVAHELMHRQSKVAHGFSTLILMTMFMPSYQIEHIYGHHKDAATPNDASSAPRGTGFYKFFIRAFFLNFYKAWKIVYNKKSSHRSLFLSKFVYMIFCYGLLTLILIVLYWVLGIGIVLYFLGQSFIAIAVMELTNYIQHYGLRRKEISPGKYERFDHRHSWDSDNTFSNLLLLNLPRHTDHHLKPYREYPILASANCSPKLPFGYLVSLILALIPPVWIYLMDKEIDKYFKLTE